MTTANFVMFTCPSKKTPVRARIAQRNPLTRAQFENWQAAPRGGWNEDCSACGQTHLIIAEDCFLEGEATA